MMPKIVRAGFPRYPIVFYKHFLERTVLDPRRSVSRISRLGRDDRRARAHPGTLHRTCPIPWWDSCGDELRTRQPWMSPGQQGFHFVSFRLMVALLQGTGGARWGLDPGSSRAETGCSIGPPPHFVAARRPPSWPSLGSGPAMGGGGPAGRLTMSVRGAERRAEVPVRPPAFATTASFFRRSAPERASDTGAHRRTARCGYGRWRTTRR